MGPEYIPSARNTHHIGGGGSGRCRVPTITIRNRWTDAVLYTHETTVERQASGLATRDALEAAVRSRANLSGANLSCAYLSCANLSGANLSCANLSCANLSGANLSCANLSCAYLSCANLSGAYLSGANLSGANLSRADLSCADLSRADLSGAKWRGGVTINRAPLQISGLHWIVYILDKHMQIGCELHSLAEWRTFDDARIVQMDGRDALRFWRQNKTALLALAEADGRGAAEAQPVAA